MASQTGQRLRRNASPSTKQGPMRATQQFGLISGGPARANGRKASPPPSPTPSQAPPSALSHTRPASETRIETDALSPTSPIGHLVERPKAAFPASSCGHQIKRTGSLDTIAGPYLAGHWPRDAAAYLGLSQSVCVCMVDKQTQTPDAWTDVSSQRKAGHKRSQSVGNGDQLNLIKHRLQTTKNSSKQNVLNGQRYSPIQGSHTLPTNLSSVCLTTKILMPHCIHKLRIRGSVEGLNQEVEKLIVSGPKKDTERYVPDKVTPEGRRAPLIELLGPVRSIDTQTPSGPTAEDGRTSRNSNSGRSLSASPSLTAFSDNDKSPEPQSVGKISSSPKPNSKFLREPPDGCERIELIDESKSDTFIQSERGQAFVFQINKSSVDLRPSERSAFCVLRPSAIAVVPTSSAILEEAV